MVYEIIIGKRLSEYFIEQDYDRKWSADIPITTLEGVVKTLNKELHEAFKSIQAPLAISEILSEFAILEKQLQSSNEPGDLQYSKVRELLSLISFYGYEVYLLERPDLMSENDEESPNRCYLLDSYDKVFTSLNRVGTGYCVQFDAPENMSVPDMVFSLLGRSVRFSKLTMELLDIDKKSNTYDSLLRTHSSWTMDVSDLIRFMKDYGYAIIGVQG